MSLRWLFVSAVVAVMCLVQLPAGATLLVADCESVSSQRGAVSDAGGVDVFVGERRNCHQAPVETGYPRKYWTTHDIFWGATADCPAGMVEGIRRYWLVTAPGQAPTMLYDTPGCVPLPAAGEDGSVDTIDVEAILRGVLPRPDLAHDPYADGLAGLETYFWYAGDALDEIDHDTDPTTPPRYGWHGSVSRNGITITATLHVQRFSWQVETDRTLTSLVPGSPDDPAAEHTYPTTGTYDLTASTTWTGSYSWTIDAPTDDTAPTTPLTGNGTLNNVTLTSPPQPFRVRELRAVPADDRPTHP